MWDEPRFRERAASLLGSLGPRGDRPAERVTDLDSFALLEMILVLEDEFSLPILETLDEFEGRTLDDFVAFIGGRHAVVEDSRCRSEA